MGLTVRGSDRAALTEHEGNTLLQMLCDPGSYLMAMSIIDNQGLGWKDLIAQAVALMGEDKAMHRENLMWISMRRTTEENLMWGRFPGTKIPEPEFA